ncbi:hypothetical protein PJL18_02222 [Paenarthrobacter nicotinovorans]|nr:hypothetical protein [Paenarthrobacter nicotinovorans]
MLAQLVRQDLKQSIPDVVPRFVVRRTGLGRIKSLRPIVAAQPNVGIGGLHLHALGWRLFVKPHTAFNCFDHLHGRFEPGNLSIAVDAGTGTFGDKVPQRARLHALLPQAWEDIGHVRQIALMRSDEQYVASSVVVAVAEPGIGVQKVGRAVQGNHRLTGTRTAVDHQRPTRAGTDDPVLVGLDSPQDIPHPRRAAAPKARDKGGLVIKRGISFHAGSGENFVPVVGHPGTGPAVPAPAHQAHRVGMCCSEERFGSG